MTIVTARHGIEGWQENRRGLEFVVMCTDSQVTDPVTETKSMGQKIHPFGNRIISGSGNTGLINLSVNRAYNFSQQNPQAPIEDLASDLLSYLGSKLRGEVLNEQVGEDLHSDIIITGPDRNDTPWHLFMISLPWEEIMAGKTQLLTSTTSYIEGMRSLRKSTRGALEENHLATNGFLESLLRAYSAAYRATDSVYVDANFQLAVQLCSLVGFDMHILYPPEVVISGNPGFSCKSDAEMRVRLFTGHSEPDLLRGFTESKFLGEVDLLGEFHCMFNIVLQKAARLRFMLENEGLSAQEIKGLEETYSAAKSNLSLPVGAFLSGSLNDARAAVKAYHSSFI